MTPEPSLVGCDVKMTLEGSAGPSGRAVWTSDGEFSDSRGKLVNGKSVDPERQLASKSGMKRLPKLVRQFLAEVLGTFLLVLMGDGAIAQFKYLQQGDGEKNFVTVALGYGFALMIGILSSGGVSGGHLNPAVTLALACVKKCRWVQVPVYWLAQYLGAFLGAAVVYGVYADAIGADAGDFPSQAGIFASYPAAHATDVTLVFDQALGTAVLLIIILSVTDGRNMKVSSGLVPLLIGLGLAAIHISLALNAGCAINPARDLSPRLFTLIAGFGGETFSSFNYFFWIPWLMPHVGGVLGALIYFFAVEYHHDDMDDDL